MSKFSDQGMNWMRLMHSHVNKLWRLAISSDEKYHFFAILPLAM